MSELGVDVALITLRAQSDQIAAVIAQHLEVPVTVEVDEGLVRLHVATRARSEGLEVVAATVFEQITVGVGDVAYVVTSGPHLRIV